MAASQSTKELLRVAQRWISLGPTVRKLADEPDEFQQILELIISVAISEIEYIKEGSIYRVEALEAPRTLVQIEQLMKGEGGRIGRHAEKPRFPSFREGDGSAASDAMVNCQPIYLDDCSSQKPYLDYKSGQQLKSLACIPVNYGKEVIAVLCVHSMERRHIWTEDDKDYLRALASIAANAISANHNEITLLPNRRQMDYIVANVIAKQTGSAGSGLWMAYMDLDHFGEVNKKFEHRPADEVIRQFARILVNQKGEKGQVFHRHGDEFSILWQDLTRQEVLALAERIARAVTSFEFTVKGESVRSELNRGMSASMGIQEWNPSLSGDILTDKADEMSGRAKDKGDHKGLILWRDSKGNTGQRKLRARPS